MLKIILIQSRLTVERRLDAGKAMCLKSRLWGLEPMGFSLAGYAEGGDNKADYKANQEAGHETKVPEVKHDKLGYGEIHSSFQCRLQISSMGISSSAFNSLLTILVGPNSGKTCKIRLSICLVMIWLRQARFKAHVQRFLASQCSEIRGSRPQQYFGDLGSVRTHQHLPAVTQDIQMSPTIQALGSTLLSAGL